MAIQWHHTRNDPKIIQFLLTMMLNPAAVICVLNKFVFSVTFLIKSEPSISRSKTWKNKTYSLSSIIIY